MSEDLNVPIVDIYRKSLDLFQDRDRFAQGYFQFDKNGERCGWREGYSFCALGALSHFGDGFSNRAQCCLQRVSEHLFGGLHIQHVNDELLGYESVIKALEFAIELWDGHQPTEEELGMSVKNVLKKRNGDT